MNYAILIAEAQKSAATPEYSEMTIDGKPGTLVGRRFIMNQCRARGWSSRVVMGRQRVLKPGVIKGADIELKEAIAGYTEKEITNADESAIVLNYQGKTSFQPPSAQMEHARKCNDQDPKARVTIMHPISKNGTLDFKGLVIDKNLHRDMRKEMVLVRSGQDKTKKKRKWALNKQQKGKYYLALTESSFINRMVWRNYLDQWHAQLVRNGERRVLLVDNLSSHVLNLEHKKAWQKKFLTKLCYIDDVSYERIKIVFFPPLVTSVASDLGYYCHIQATSCKFIVLL